MKSILCVFLVLVCCIFMVMAVPAQTGKRDADTTSADIDLLLKERRDTFRELVFFAKRRFEQNTVEFDAVIHASNQLLDAELQLAEMHNDQVRLHEEGVKNFKDLENFARNRHKLAHLTFEKVLEAKAARIQAEISLLREKAQGD